LQSPPQETKNKTIEIHLPLGRVPGPGAKALGAKIMRRFSFHGKGAPRNCGMSIAECGLKKKAKSEIRNSKFEIESFDAFCAQGPSTRATTHASHQDQIVLVLLQS
jgi:hypothetical protein